MQDNNSLIESVKISKLKYMKSEPFKVNEYILTRRIYNRYYYHHYDLISVKEIDASGIESLGKIPQSECAKLYQQANHYRNKNNDMNQALMVLKKWVNTNNKKIRYPY